MVTAQRPSYLGEAPGMWATQGACNGHAVDLFFPTSTTRSTAEARAICKTCPVARACLEYSLLDPHTDGIWAGTNPNERAALRKRRRRST